MGTFSPLVANVYLVVDYFFCIDFSVSRRRLSHKILSLLLFLFLRLLPVQEVNFGVYFDVRCNFINNLWVLLNLPRALVEGSSKGTDEVLINLNSYLLYLKCIFSVYSSLRLSSCSNEYFIDVERV